MKRVVYCLVLVVYSLIGAGCEKKAPKPDATHTVNLPPYVPLKDLPVAKEFGQWSVDAFEKYLAYKEAHSEEITKICQQNLEWDLLLPREMWDKTGKGDDATKWSSLCVPRTENGPPPHLSSVKYEFDLKGIASFSIKQAREEDFSSWRDCDTYRLIYFDRNRDGVMDRVWIAEEFQNGDGSGGIHRSEDFNRDDSNEYEFRKVDALIERVKKESGYDAVYAEWSPFLE